ncbi:cyclin-T2-like isoform X1 [Gouania willdenowi]|uniref:Cyclin-T2-like n=1 Tax=Gouania willdenowi TaxID=441366 RepID=A0A8C5DVL5_GOUWI|nr:cyclin-T2-like isoform X1 [Gouania willdenowi]
MAVYRGPSAKWLFTREQLDNTPSRRCGIEADRELSYRQQAANLIQDIGQRLNVSQLIINTAIVYMHRFYMLHSFNKFHRNVISQVTLFLASKVEEQPRKLELVIKIAHAIINPQEPALDTKSNAFQLQLHEFVVLEAIVLQTLGFDITIDHPHTDVVKCCQLVRASKDLAQTSYFMATNSLHLTTFCLQHRPTVVACVCIHLACKWSNWEIPVSTDGKHWWEYVDCRVTLQLLDELTHEFLQILEKTPSKLKRIRNWRAIQAAKKPKTEGVGVDSSFQGSSLESVGGVASSFFSSSDASDMSLNAMGYAPYQPLGEPFPQPAHSDFTLLKHKHKAVGRASGNEGGVSRPQKVLTLEKYREKHTEQNGVREEPSTDSYTPPLAASAHHHHHKKRSQTGERRDKSSSKRPRLSHAPQPENGSNEELKMRIKVSSDSQKHKEHGHAHRHTKHGHTHTASSALRANDGSTSTTSSRKRPHPHTDPAHHPPSKSSRSKVGVASSHYTEPHGHDGAANGVLINGQHTDYKNTFDMLDSLLSAQGMNL